ncbi:hypothetical protein, partial [Mycoplasma bradburyae]|uniref:hypothetical protein n=1 Tax=Mycoplasma bradburyae TaxID=2963128 RepID=UPI0023421BD3
MKKKNILKFISLLGIGSFVALSAASCKQPINEKPKTPSSDGGDNKTNPGGGSSNNNPNNGGSVT